MHFSKSYLTLCLLALLLPVAGFSQRERSNNEDRLALQYFEQKEFDKANLYFDELYDQNPEIWYTTYYKSLLGAKDYTRAEKITKKQQRQNKLNVSLYVNLGKIYKLQNDEKKAKESYDKAIKELNGAQPYVQPLATAF